MSFIQDYFSDADTIVQSDTGASGYVASANSTVVRVVTTTDTAFSLTYPVHVTSHSGTSKTGTVDIINGNTWVIANSGTAFTSDYAAGQYIQVGANTSTNIRRIATVNSSVIVCNTAFAATANGQTHAVLPYTATPTSITVQRANGVITDTNLGGTTLEIDSLQVAGVQYIVGEKVTMVDGSNVDQGANGTVNFANSTTLVLGEASGTFTNGLYIRGSSSLQKATITGINANPSLTIDTPQGSFLVGQTIYFKNAANLVTVANATLVSYYFTPNELTEYVISPTVSISGDGEDALAYSTVNATTNSISSIVVINPGINYTYANVTIAANGSYGSGAEAEATIAPINGHGYDIDQELGARYAGISVLFDDINTELLKFPGYGEYRIVGILKDPLFKDLTVNLDSFDRIKLTIANREGAFEPGEIVLQPSTDTTLSAANVSANVVGVSNTSETIAITSANTTFKVGARVFYKVPTSNTAIGGLTANSHYYISFANTSAVALALTVGGANVNLTENRTTNPAEVHQLVPETSNSSVFSTFSGGATAAGICVYSNATFLELKNVKGTFVANQSLDTVYGFTSGATANCKVANTAYFTILGAEVEAVSEVTSGGVGEIETILSNTQIRLTNVSGDFQINDVLVDSQTNSYANVASLYTANGTVDVSSTFGQRFVQTVRLPLSSNTGAFTQFERVTQSVTNAMAMVIDTTHEVDMDYTNLAGGSFADGDYLESATANGYVTFANSTYLRVTAVQGSFTSGGQAINSGAVTADTSNVYPVLVLADVSGPNRFQASNTVTGETSGAQGTPSALANTIFYPDLVRESGSVTYLENIEPFERTVESKERIKIVIKF